MPPKKITAWGEYFTKFNVVSSLNNCKMVVVTNNCKKNYHNIFFLRIPSQLKSNLSPPNHQKIKSKERISLVSNWNVFCRDQKSRTKRIPRDVIEDVFQLRKKSDDFAKSVIPVTYDFVKNHLKNITVEKCEEELDGKII